MMRLANDDVGKALHAVLYRRMLSFAQECTPELPGEAFVASWLERFYRDDGTMHILVNMDDSLNVTAHAVIDVQQAMYHYILQCHQLQVDHPDITQVDEVVEYGRKLKAAYEAQAHTAIMTFMVTKNVKAYEQRYGFKAARAILIG